MHGPMIRIGNDKFGLRDARRHVVEAIKSWPLRAAAVATAPAQTTPCYFLGTVKRLLICATAIEGPIGQDIENLLELTGIQQDVLDPILGLIGPLGGLFTS